MKLDVVFQEAKCTFDAEFSRVQTASDGGFERGYAEGYEKGNTEGYTKGHEDGAQKGYEQGAESLVLGEIEVFSSDKVTSFRQYMFQSCRKLKELNTPNLKTLGSCSCQNCTQLKEISFPNITGAIATSVFNGCSSLEYADVGNATQLQTSSFSNCNSLLTLILRNTKVVTLASASVLNNTPIRFGYGYVYVPKALVEQYKNATNWSTFASQFRAIEDYPEIAGGGE